MCQLCEIRKEGKLSCWISRSPGRPAPKEKPQDETKLGFGKKFTDHMFVMDYTEGEGWHDARIVP